MSASGLKAASIRGPRHASDMPTPDIPAARGVAEAEVEPETEAERSMIDLRRRPVAGIAAHVHRLGCWTAMYGGKPSRCLRTPYCAVKPPSTTNDAPVTKRDSSLAR
jgi:hypothetical protein